MSTPRTIRTQEDFLQAYEEYAESIFRHCYLRLLDRELGKEVMQETFKRTWERIAEGQEIENIQLFLYRMANGLVAAARLQSPAVPAQPNTDALVTRMSKLEKDQRDLLVMHYIDHLSAEEIASITALPTETVGERLRIALTSIQSFLQYA